MTRRDREAGILKSLGVGAALMAGLAAPAYADDTKLTLSGSASCLRMPPTPTAFRKVNRSS